MRDRCFNPNNIYYSYYGGRGIIVCNEWLGRCGYINFYKWAKENGYSLNLTIDRIDSSGNYEPSNCRWATMKQQGRNKRNNRLIMYKGSEITIAEASERLDIPYSYIYYRIIKGKSLDEIIEMYKLSKYPKKILIPPCLWVFRFQKSVRKILQKLVENLQRTRTAL